jgi:hypothetical protein
MTKIGISKQQDIADSHLTHQLPYIMPADKAKLESFYHECNFSKIMD